MISLKHLTKLFLLLPLLLVGCLKKPEFLSLQNVEVLGIENNELIIELDYVVKNPNKMKAKLEESEIDIYYNEKRVGEGSKVGATILTPEKTLRLPFKCHIFLDDLVDHYPTLLGEKPAKFKAKGKSKIKILFFSFSLGIDEWISLDVEDTVQKELSKMLGENEVFRVKDTPYPHPGMQVTTLDIPLEWTNSYSFDYKLRAMNLAIFLKKNGSPVANWISDETWEIKGNDQREIPVEIVINNMQLLREGGLNVVFNTKIRLYIKGSVTVEIGGNSFELPIDTVTEFERPSTPSIPAFPGLPFGADI